jgi:hypothetical protein
LFSDDNNSSIVTIKYFALFNKTSNVLEEGYNQSLGVLHWKMISKHEFIATLIPAQSSLCSSARSSSQVFQIDDGGFIQKCA